MLEICLPRIWLTRPFKYPITSLCCHIGRQTTGVWKQITGGSNQTTAKTNQKHFWQCGTLTMISHYMNHVCVCLSLCVCVLGPECESVHGGGRPADIQRPAVCPRLGATAERSGRTLTHLCGQPTCSNSQGPAGTHTHSHTKQTRT